MPSDLAPTANNLYHGLLATFAPFVRSTISTKKLCNWKHLQHHCSLIDSINNTTEMAQITSSPLVPNLEGNMASFTKFNDLPPELRIKIWQHAMPDARTVIIKSPFTRQKSVPTSLEEGLLQESNDSSSEETWHSATQIPSLLHVNAEARYEALKHYTLSFGVGEKSQSARVYVDFARDTIFFGNPELQPQCSRLWAATRDLARIRRLAIIPEAAWRVFQWNRIDLGSLEKLVFVHNTDDHTTTAADLGPLPELVEDEQQVGDGAEAANLESELDQQFKFIERMAGGAADEDEAAIVWPLKTRIEEARDELDTLMLVLPTRWEREPVVSTAVFRTRQGAKLLRTFSLTTFGPNLEFYIPFS
ncbi:hypothetical protein F5Y16DRAFT_370780 [Xylariaceae sp. FL0255]|nr:hypothetical protein F5Y16DRAFT_370780 [Xylariaceae sp. FL0255]